MTGFLFGVDGTGDKKVNPMATQCLACGHERVERVSLPMNVADFCALANRWAKCQNCGRRKTDDGGSAVVLLLGAEHDRVVAANGGEA